MTPANELTYERALEELEQILRAMQSDQCDIDKLASMTKRATELLAACRSKLTATESELREILSKIESE